jgi:hypothetical protein
MNATLYAGRFKYTKDIFYDRRCKCREKISITKKKKSSNRSEAFEYPRDPNEEEYVYANGEEPMCKTFQIKYEQKLSSITKSLLNSFQTKYLYYAIDDVLYLLKSNPIERDNLLTILYSPVLSLQNDLSINFFDIWIQEIYINEVSKVNKFLTNKCQIFEPFSYITIILLYKPKTPTKKREPLW